MATNTTSTHPKSALVAVLGLLTIFAPLATDMYLAAIGHVADSMQATHSAAELSLSLFFLGLCFGQLLVGPLIDGYGRKMPLLIGVAVFIVTSCILTVTSNITVFNTVRVFQAMGACAGMVVGRAIVSDLYEGQAAAKAMTVLVMMLTIGPIVSPTLGSVLLVAFGWRSIFVVMILFGILAFLLAYRVVPETLPVANRTQQPLRTGIRAMGRLVADRSFFLAALVAACVQAGMFAFITGSSGVFQNVYGFSSFQFGGVFAAIAAALLVFGQINKSLLNRYSADTILRNGLWAYVAVAATLVGVSTLGSVWVFVPVLWLTIGLVGLLSANAMALAMAAGSGGAGVTSAMLGAIQFITAFGVSACVALADGGTALPLALGVFVPAVIAFGLNFVLNRKSAVQPVAG